MPDDQIKWRLPDKWTVVQSSGSGFRIEVSQDGNMLKGTTHMGLGNDSAEMTGMMSGSVEGDVMNFTIYWPDETVTEFHGTVNPDGGVGGTTVSRPDGATHGKWHAEPALSAWA